MGISAELEAALRVYRAWFDSWSSQRIAATICGVARTGRLIEVGSGGCQPCLLDADGRRWRILDRATVRAASDELTGDLTEQQGFSS